MIASLLQKARTELLELGLRNTLLNHRVTKSRGVSVVGMESTDVFWELVENGSSLTFASTGSGVGANLLKTPYEEAVLQSRLLSTYYAARTHIEERGVNILFVALGMLCWYEDEASDRELRAPLILVPVALARTSAKEKFAIKFDDEEIEGNQSLAARLAEMGIKYPELPDMGELSPAEYFQTIAQAVSGQARWRVDPNDMALGFFSFSKLLMFKDLEPGSWCSEENPDGTPNLAALLRDGFRGDGTVATEDQYLDKAIAPNVLSQVVDADSSQALAMIDVRSGVNLVIQGPPGTGKSQTITNIIADAIGAGKRVLFVAEKSAALEVVKRRLDKVGLGVACLELHSHSANKKAVLAELERTLRLGRPRRLTTWSLEHYKRIRDQLNAHCVAMNAPLEGTDWTPQQIMGELSAIRQRQGAVTLPPVTIAVESVTWSKSTFRQKQEPVARLADLLRRLGKPCAHPLIVSGLASVLPSDRDAIELVTRQTIRTTLAAEAALRGLSGTLDIAIRCDRSDADLLMRATQRALAAPDLSGVVVRAGEWVSRSEEIGEALESGARHSALRGQYAAALLDDAWEQDVLHIRQVLNSHGTKWWRWLSSEYRRARASVARLCRGTHAGDVTSQLELVDAIMEAARHRRRVSELEPLTTRLFGPQWRGLTSDWVALCRTFEWIVQLHRDIGLGACPSAFIEFLAGNPKLESLKLRLETMTLAIAAYDESATALGERLSVTADDIEKLKCDDLPTQRARFEAMAGKLDDLSLITAFNNLRLNLASEGLPWVTEVCMDWQEAPKFLVDFFRRSCLEPLLRQAYNERPALRTADGAVLTASRATFRNLDQASLLATRHEIAEHHHQGLPQLAGAGQVGILAREFQKRSRHLPIRKLISQAGNAIQAIKPVFMMSPMSIAAFIPPHTAKFDLVIFDEASQVKPVDALGAVMRGDQLVVVGDSKQLPPTSFFDTLVAGDDQSDDEPSATADIESVLGLACSRGARERMLRWHYRSRHHSLVAISNQLFYDNRLVVFPSPEPCGRQLGLVMHHLPKTVYDRGKSRTNQLEAEVVAKAVIAHARSNPDLSLGVAAFSLPQAEAIRDHVERLRRQNLSTEPFFSAHPFEPYFVKNLESVQGDERDVIFISVGYGRDSSGYIAMTFGALNGQGGERRLNVLITRARRSCEVFTNLTHEDIDTTRTSAQGVAAFKAFLKYAKTGVADVPDDGNSDVDSPFEEEVSRAIRAAGHSVQHQVGSGGFRIDLAIRDHEKPGRYLLGIECDGATYHRSRSARDRDRLRQQVLEDLGWSIHRIWSSDWFSRPESELHRALEAIEHARLRSGRSPPPTSEPAPQPVADVARTGEQEAIRAVELQGAHYQLASLTIHLNGVELHEVVTDRMAHWVASVAEVEGPVHIDDVARRVALAAGLQRVGNRIESAIGRAISAAERNGAVRRAGSFIWHRNASEPVVRNRSNLEASARRIDRIAPEEIGLAVKTIVEASHGISLTELHVAVCRMFGLQRTTDEMVDVIRQVTLTLCQSGALAVENEHVIIKA